MRTNTYSCVDLQQKLLMEHLKYRRLRITLGLIPSLCAPRRGSEIRVTKEFAIACGRILRHLRHLPGALNPSVVEPNDQRRRHESP